jgi:uncharacterized membrane protein
MGEAFALLSMTMFATADVMINRGATRNSRSRGAFLSIIMTFGIALLIWFVHGVLAGFAPINRTAVAWFALAGVLTVLIGRVFLYASIQSLGAVKGSAVKRLNPFFSVILGVLLLNEAVSGMMAVGMLLIFSSFGLLVHQSFRTASDYPQLQKKETAFGKLASRGYLFGPISALAYASGYVARKQGLLLMPDAVFGTMVGALTGALLFIGVALFYDWYREDLRATFAEFNPWLLAAGFFSTLGQIAYFFALTYSAVSKIALITSLEVFMTMFLSYLVFRGKLKITSEVVVAATLGVLGSLLVIRY